MTQSSVFEKLTVHMSDVGNLRAAAAVLEWDQEVYMPVAGAAARGRQLATLHAHTHKLFTHPDVGDMIARARDEGLRNSDEEALVNEIAYQYERASRIPDNFVRRFSKARSTALQAWIQARKEEKYSVFLPHLKTLIALSREKASYLGFEETPYNALLENYERGMTAASLRAIFEVLGNRQRALLAHSLDIMDREDRSWLDQSWDTARQWSFSETVLRDMGFDFQSGRQDKSVHPFTTNFSIHDVRITTRLSENDFFSALFSSIHEGGHALYEQGFREEDEGSFLAASPSLGLHESQSRLWENAIGRCLPFWEHYLPALRTLYPGQLDQVSAVDIYKAANHIAPSLIRVEADECTYNLHVILRFELESALIEDELDAADLPAAWNEKIERYLGLTVPNDGMGCLQDIHWSHGSFGYFPTYALGNLYAAQLLKAMEQAVPSLWEDIGQGQFQGCLEWLREHVHRVGNRKTAVQIIQEATGAIPGPDAFLEYLEAKIDALAALT
ncbi:MAG: carboxypeptidase M32 [Candidatus Hydrogenedentes bacterium]|nr:carboxypeptidase M32 [Candidatus Hydrogenedentota bacterium]